jgi:hypothetical protein
MILWLDLPESLDVVEYSSTNCGYLAFKDNFSQENCCRSSLDLDLSQGVQSIGTSLDVTKFPAVAKDQQYCMLETSDTSFGFSKAYFAANGACNGAFRCFSNQSLLMFPESNCAGDPQDFALGTLPVDIYDGSINATLVAISQSAASVQYSYTTYFPASLLATSLDNSADIIALICGIFSVLLPTGFFFW